MTRLVVDASIAIKWFVPEVHRASALTFLAPGHELLAPELIWAEFGNVLWKKRQRQAILADESRRIWAEFTRVPITPAPVAPFVPLALEVADRTRRTVYDSLYLVLAERMACRLVTADRRLYNAIQGDPLATHILWVEDQP